MEDTDLPISGRAPEGIYLAYNQSIHATAEK